MTTPPSLSSEDVPPMQNRAAWRAYWQARGLPWRIEPEIDKERCEFLAERRSIAPNIKHNIYPFGGVSLTRADIEWLLITHEDGRGPIDWNDAFQHEREGLDVRGANLAGVNLSSLPLARLRAGINWQEGNSPTPDQIESAAAHMEKVDLREAHLEGAILCHVYLQGAALYRARLDEANLSDANMQNTVLYDAHLEKANLDEAHMEQAYLFRAHLEDANLQGAFFDAGTNLEHIHLRHEHQHVGVSLADVRWGNSNLSIIDWSEIHMLGDEYKARHYVFHNDSEQDEDEQREAQMELYETAVRANRQLAVALQGQGMNEDAARFAYRAQRLQRLVQWRQKRFGQFLFSLFLDLIAGYGYKPGRSFIAYLCVILSFAAAYYFIGVREGIVFNPLEAVVFSMTSFHGRGFSPGQNITLGNPITVLAALEAFVGLTIEVTFIATLTQRLFGK